MNDTKKSAPTRATLTLKGVRPKAMQLPVVPVGTDSPVSNDRFAFVWRSDGRRPRKRHPTTAAAIAEAERLAEANPNVEFGVYEARLATRVRR